MLYTREPGPVRDLSGILNKDMMKQIERNGGWNHFRSWRNLELLNLSGYKGWLTIRDTVRDSPYFLPEVEPDCVKNAIWGLLARGADLNTLYFQEIPTPGLVKRYINFEVQQSPDYLCLKYGTGQCNLRHDLETNGIEVYGLRANAILRQYLGPDSYDDLHDLLVRFRGVCFEATRFSEPVGTLGRELVIWEGRNY